MAGYFGTKAEAEAQDGEGTDREEEKRPDDKKEGEARPAAAALTAEGELCFTFSVRGRPERDAQEEYLRQMDRLGYKIGLRLRADQSVLAFLFRRDDGEVRMTENPDVSTDLAAVFGTTSWERWVGFTPESRARRRHSFPEPGVICYRFVLRLAPRPRLPMVIPMVIRHDNGRSFGESFIGGLLTIRARTVAR